jgi:isoleucyl-tRNA synthetase
MPQLLFLSSAKRGYIPFKSVIVYPAAAAAAATSTTTTLSQKNGKLSEEFDSYMLNILKKFQPDVLRVWVIEDEGKGKDKDTICQASTDFRDFTDLRRSISRSEEKYNVIKDVCFSMLKIIKQLKESESSPKTGSKKPGKPLSRMSVSGLELDLALDLDKIVLNRVGQISVEVTESFKSNRVKEAYNLIYEFCGELRRLEQLGLSNLLNLKVTTLDCILNQLIKLIAPILPYTAEMIWQNLSTNQNLKEKPSIFLSEWQMPDPNSIDEGAVSEWKKIIKSKARL